MGCKFCASTIGGRVRNLTVGELLGQVIAAARDLGERMDGIVMMGIGEPLDNFDNVVRFLHLVNHEKGQNIGYRHISLSTCGLVDRIDELAGLSLPITLSISLHAADDETRSAIMPINRRYNVDALLRACKRYYDKTKRRISFEYTLIAGKNDAPEAARKLAGVLNRYLRTRTDTMPIHVNLIPVNEVEETGFTRSDKKAVKKFADVLTECGIRATVRRKLGADIISSCGQLRRASLDIKYVNWDKIRAKPKSEGLPFESKKNRKKQNKTKRKERTSPIGGSEYRGSFGAFYRECHGVVGTGAVWQYPCVFVLERMADGIR